MSKNLIFAPRKDAQFEVETKLFVVVPTMLLLIPKDWQAMWRPAVQLDTTAYLDLTYLQQRLQILLINGP